MFSYLSGVNKPALPSARSGPASLAPVVTAGEHLTDGPRDRRSSFSRHAPEEFGFKSRGYAPFVAKQPAAAAGRRLLSIV
jgi:hypothetical protein